jgi:hypothetical protein
VEDLAPLGLFALTCASALLLPVKRYDCTRGMPQNRSSAANKAYGAGRRVTSSGWYVGWLDSTQRARTCWADPPACPSNCGCWRSSWSLTRKREGVEGGKVSRRCRRVGHCQRVRPQRRGHGGRAPPPRAPLLLLHLPRPFLWTLAATLRATADALLRPVLQRRLYLYGTAVVNTAALFEPVSHKHAAVRAAVRARERALAACGFLPDLH